MNVGCFAVDKTCGKIKATVTHWEGADETLGIRISSEEPP